jgi:hypothetical protein
MSFDTMYSPDTDAPLQQQAISSLARFEAIAPGIGTFLGRYAGVSFNRGLYRIHPIVAMPAWTAIAGDAFPDFKARLFCFSYDWLGRHFAIDIGRRENGQCQVLMLEPGTGEVLEIPTHFMDFHDAELVKHQNEAVAADFYRAWLDVGGLAPDSLHCIGYKTPLFLGGEDALANLELVDMEVYWSLCGQLLAQIRDRARR